MGQADPIHRPTSVLLVEDETLILEMVSDVLSGQGFEVHAVSNAGEALQYLTAGSVVDVLFTDINLPGMDGLSLAMLARQMRPALPVVYASGRVASLSENDAVPRSEFVPKPYDPTQIGNVLTKAAGQPH
jgi:CheY-like chemotaxis protein